MYIIMTNSRNFALPNLYSTKLTTADQIESIWLTVHNFATTNVQPIPAASQALNFIYIFIF